MRRDNNGDAADSYSLDVDVKGPPALRCRIQDKKNVYEENSSTGRGLCSQGRRCWWLDVRGPRRSARRSDSHKVTAVGFLCIEFSDIMGRIGLRYTEVSNSSLEADGSQKPLWSTDSAERPKRGPALSPVPTTSPFKPRLTLLNPLLLF